MKRLFALCVLWLLALSACQPSNLVASTVEAASSDLPPGPTKLYEIKTTDDDPAAKFHVIEVVLDFAPGVWTPPHTHGGQTFNMVLDGEIGLRENGTIHVYKAGEGWSDTPNQLHQTGNIGTSDAHLFVTFLLPEGAQLTTVHANMTK